MDVKERVDQREIAEGAGQRLASESPKKPPASPVKEREHIHEDPSHAPQPAFSNINAPPSAIRRHASDLAREIIAKAEDDIKEFENRIQEALSAASAAEERAESIIQKAEERAKIIDQEAVERSQALKVQAEEEAAHLLQERTRQVEILTKSTLEKVQRLVAQELENLVSELNASSALQIPHEQAIRQGTALPDTSQTTPHGNAIVKDAPQAKDTSLVSPTTSPKTEPNEEAGHNADLTKELALYEGRILLVFPRDTPITVIRNVRGALINIGRIVVTGPRPAKDSMILELLVSYPEPLIKTLEGVAGVSKVEDISNTQGSANVMENPLDAASINDSPFRMLTVTPNLQQTKQ